MALPEVVELREKTVRKQAKIFPQLKEFLTRGAEGYRRGWPT